MTATVFIFISKNKLKAFAKNDINYYNIQKNY